MKRSDLDRGEYPKYHGSYIEKLPDISFTAALKESERHLVKLMETLSEEAGNFKYESSKWSIKELLLHLIDVERVFIYRSLRIARNDFTKVPGFDHDDYVLQSSTEKRSISSIVEEYNAQRNSSLHFFNNLTTDELKRIESLDGKSLSVRATAYFISGHERHHTKILEERYLTKLKSN